MTWTCDEVMIPWPRAACVAPWRVAGGKNIHLEVKKIPLRLVEMTEGFVWFTFA